MATLKELRERFSKPRAKRNLEEPESSDEGSVFPSNTIGALQEAFGRIYKAADKAADSMRDTVEILSEHLLSSSSVVYRSIFPEVLKDEEVLGYNKTWIAMGFETSRDPHGEFFEVLARKKEKGAPALMVQYSRLYTREDAHWRAKPQIGLESLLREKDRKARKYLTRDIVDDTLEARDTISPEEARKDLEKWYHAKKDPVVAERFIGVDEATGKSYTALTFRTLKDEEPSKSMKGTTPSGMPFEFKIPGLDDMRILVDAEEPDEDEDDKGK